MAAAVILQRDRLARRPGGPIDLDRRDAPARAGRVLDLDVVRRRPVSDGKAVSGPAPRDAGIENERATPEVQPQDRLDAGLVHPAGRAGVPGPSAATDVR